MSPITMATHTANVPHHSTLHPILKPAPMVVHPQQISGARHIARVALRPLGPLRLQSPPATIHVITITISTGVSIAHVAQLPVHLVTTRVTMAITITGTTRVFVLQLRKPPLQVLPHQVINCSSFTLSRIYN